MTTATTSVTVPALVLRRTFNAPCERVFDAWTTPEVLRTWFGPPGTGAVEATFDARKGGQFRIAMLNSDGEPFVSFGTVTEFRRPERLAFTFTWEEDDKSEEHETQISIDFIARGERTEMVFTHENLASEISRSRHTEGWNGTFDNLAGLLPNPPVVIRGMDFSGYMCKDAERAIGFYRDVFGLEPALIYPDNRGAEYELPDGTTFGLWGGGGKVMPFQPSNGILFAVDDLTAAVAKLTAREIAITYQTETPYCTMAMIHDTEGNIVTLHQRKR